MIRTDLIPLKSGTIRLTPYNKLFVPQFDLSYTVKRPFLTSTQVTTTRTTEDLGNGNGDDKTFNTGERYNLVLNTNVFDHKFNALLSGSQSVTSNKHPILHDTTIIPDTTGSVVLPTDAVPVASPEDNEIHLEIRNAYSELLEETTDTPTATTYKYDPDTKTLTFAASLANQELSCVYYVAASDDTEAYQSSPIIKTNVFLLEVFAEVRSAETEEKVMLYEKMLRATLTGDLPNMTTQKSISAPLTYNFQSAPVPQGLSAFYQSFTPIED